MPNFKSDILILGAGASGLSAAAELKSHRRSINIIEARDRIGGRILTVKKAAPFPIELGAEFVHGTEETLWNLIERFQIRVAETNGRNWFRTDRGLEYIENFYLSMDPVVDELLAQACSSDQDQSLAEFFAKLLNDKPDLAVEIARTKIFIEENTCARADKISLKFIARGEKAMRSVGDIPLRPIDGFIEVLNRLKADLTCDELHLSTVAHKIEWQPGTVKVSAKQGDCAVTFEAKQVIVTLPVGVLKLSKDQPGAVEFSPPLETKEQALQELEMGQVTRLVAVFKTRFWTELDLFGEVRDQLDGHGRKAHREEERDQEEKEHEPEEYELGYMCCEDAIVPTWWSQLPIYSHQLIGWLPGPTPAALTNGDVKENLKEFATSSLSRILGVSQSKIEEEMSEIYAHDWNNDPYTKGAYSYCVPGGIEANRILAEPVESTLYFAGEATESEGFTGTVHGALRSGLRAAKEILAKT